MGPETVATLIVVAVIVLAIAYHLIAIASGLKTVGKTPRCRSLGLPMHPTRQEKPAFRPAPCPTS